MRTLSKILFCTLFLLCIKLNAQTQIEYAIYTQTHSGYYTENISLYKVGDEYSIDYKCTSNPNGCGGKFSGKGNKKLFSNTITFSDGKCSVKFKVTNEGLYFVEADEGCAYYFGPGCPDLWGGFYKRTD